MWRDSFVCFMPHSWAKKETPTFAPNDCSGSVHTWPDSFATHMNHSYVWRDLFIHATWLIHMCDMTHSHLTWSNQVINTFTLIPHYCRGSIHMWDMTHSYVWHDSFIYVTWLIHMCDMTHSHLTWSIHVLDDTRLYTQRLQREHSYVTWLIHTWHNSFIC